MDGSILQAKKGPGEYRAESEWSPNLGEEDTGMGWGVLQAKKGMEDYRDVLGCPEPGRVQGWIKAFPKPGRERAGLGYPPNP